MNLPEINHHVESSLEALDFPSVDLSLELGGLLLSFHAHASCPQSLTAPWRIREDDRPRLLESYNVAMSALVQKAYLQLRECHDAFEKSLLEAVKNHECPCEESDFGKLDIE